MMDKHIIQLYFERSEDAIRLTAETYGRYLYTIAHRILHDKEEAEESVNDTYHGAWNAIPPNRPDSLKLFLARITRNLSLDRLEYLLAKKRNRNMEMVLDELHECIPDKSDVEQRLEQHQITDVLNRFLGSLEEQNRMIFLERYWYAESVKEISEKWSYSESKVKSILFRTRKKLKNWLEQEGIAL
ncbi:MAG: sigma-70 family RNA polymerase sigma factor [Peptococcaceae bacterium]|nr:sigma-70 family RNA polymerase sigma factor [Peptococcaceae bacterium]